MAADSGPPAVAPRACALRAAVTLPIILAVTTVSCTGARSLLPGLASSPHEEYASTLSRAGLETSALGREWVAASVRALAGPVEAVLPFHETGYFSGAYPAAIAYRLPLARGRVIVVEVGFESSEPARLFVDLFRLLDQGEPEPERVASLEDDETTLRFEVEEDGDYLLRLQPELLRGGRYTVAQRTEASLRVFPVSGLTARAVQSGFGAARDGGSREHQGLDIFAGRGTPVLAVVDGMASPSSNKLGGTVVWLRDAGRRRTFYYAHLDRTAHTSDRRVEAGDVIGFVGNTGNARTTAPHLHFGVYATRPVDPLPFLAPDDSAPSATTVPLDLIGHWARVMRTSTSLRRGAHAAATAAEVVPRGSVLAVEGAGLRAYRVQLPDGTQGYVPAGDISAAWTSARRVRLDAPAPLLEAPEATAVMMAELPDGATVTVLGSFGAYRLVRMGDGTLGWLPGERAESVSGPPDRPA